MKIVRTVVLLTLLLGVCLIFASQPVFAAGAANDRTVLILSSTVTGGAASREAFYATSAGFTVEMATNAQWAAKSAADFATYRALILGDATCTGIGAISAAEANRAVWGPVIDGNIIMLHSASYVVPRKTSPHLAAGCINLLRTDVYTKVLP